MVVMFMKGRFSFMDIELFDYDLPEEVIDKTVAKYKEAYERLTGEPFEA